MVYSRNEAVLVHRLRILALGNLDPHLDVSVWSPVKTHLLHILQNHVGVTVKRLDTTQKLLVIPQRDQDLAVVANSLLQHRQRSLGDLPLLELANLSLVELRLGNGSVLTGSSAATRP